MTPVTADALGVILPGATPARVALFVDSLNSAMLRYDIVTPERQAAFIAQVGYESTNLTRLVENLDYTHAERLMAVFPTHFTSLDQANGAIAGGPAAIANFVYANRNGNGDEASGDGWRFKGRGLIQTTGRDNYARTSQGLYSDNLTLIARPEALEQPGVAALAAAFFWSDRGCNELADQADFRQITRVINGGYAGWNERAALWSTAREVLV
jgi:putative chitinase